MVTVKHNTLRQGIWAVVGLRAQNLESPRPAHVTKSKTNSVCAALKKFTDWYHSSALERKSASEFLYLHFQRKEEPGAAAVPGTRDRDLCSRKLVHPHTHCLFIITQLSVCYCLGNCGHQQTQQNNNAQGTILCTGPWEGPVEFL